MAPRALLLATLGLAACGAPRPAAEAPAGPDPLAAWLASEHERLVAAADGLGEPGEAAIRDLESLARETAAGRTLLAASRLATPRVLIEARRYGRERAESISDLAALEAEASTVRAELDRLEARMDGDLPSRPAAVRALADAGWVHAREYGSAAVAYARVTSLEAGLFYLGAARSLMATAAGLAAVGVEARATDSTGRPSAPALEAELADLDRRGIAAYREPGAEVDRHSAFIAWNAEVKEARDLLAAGRLDGALLATLNARRRLAEIEGPGDGEAPELGDLRDRTAAFRARCASAPWDATLGLLFVETAEASLADDAPGPDALRRARAVVVAVLPRYFELSEETTP